MRVENKVDLGKLETAKDATYNSSTEGGLSRCLPDTRTDLLEQIFNWAADPVGKHIFWLCGKAGTGKSTISRTVAQKLDDDGLLGASFFFKRGRADRSHAKLLFPLSKCRLCYRSRAGSRFAPLRQILEHPIREPSATAPPKCRPRQPSIYGCSGRDRCSR
jgi:hypothetical protein